MSSVVREEENGHDVIAPITEALKPKTFEELKALPIQCKRCGSKIATHTLSMTAAVVGRGRGATVTTIPKVPVCEQCGVEVFAVVRKALKA